MRIDATKRDRDRTSYCQYAANCPHARVRDTSDETIPTGTPEFNFREARTNLVEFAKIDLVTIKTAYLKILAILTRKSGAESAICADDRDAPKVSHAASYLIKRLLGGTRFACHAIVTRQRVVSQMFGRRRSGALQIAREAVPFLRLERPSLPSFPSLKNKWRIGRIRPTGGVATSRWRQCLSCDSGWRKPSVLEPSKEAATATIFGLTSDM